MKIQYFSKKTGKAKLVPNSLDDLYHLSKLVEPGDLAGAKTSRKIKIGGERGRQKVSRRTCFIRIKVKDSELDYTSEVLRISGEVEEGPDEIPKGSAHTLNIEENLMLELVKESWKKHQIARMNKAKKHQAATLLVCALDDDKAGFAGVSDAGVRELGEVGLSLASKRAKVSSKQQYEDLVKTLKIYFEQTGARKVVIASPSFWKNELFKVVKQKAKELAGKVRLEKVSTGGLAGVREVVSKGVGSKSQLEEEENFMKEFNKRLAKNGKVTYGFREVKTASAAIEKLALSEKFVARMRKKGKYSQVEKLIDTVESAQGKVFVIDSKSSAGKKLDGLGGIAALLRYKV